MPELKGTHGFSDHQTFKEVVNGLFWVVVSVTLILDTQALCRYQMRDKQAQKTYKEKKSKPILYEEKNPLFTILESSR